MRCGWCLCRAMVADGMTAAPLAAPALSLNLVARCIAFLLRHSFSSAHLHARIVPGELSTPKGSIGLSCPAACFGHPVTANLKKAGHAK